MSRGRGEHDVLVFNPLPWSREISGPVFDRVVTPRGTPDDPTSGRHFQDRDTERGLPAGFAVDFPSGPSGLDNYLLAPTAVPGFGYRVVPVEELIDRDEWAFDERATVETDRFRVTFDRERGGISSWVDRQRNRELVDRDGDYPLAGFVHEAVADESLDQPRQALFDLADVDDWHVSAAGLPGAETGFNPDWRARRTGPSEVRRHRVYETPSGYDVRQRLAAPQLASDVELRVRVPHDGETLVVEATWEMGTTTRPESTYLAFPFDIDDPVARVDVGGQSMRPGRDQLAGSCHDYYTAQRWVDLSADGRGVTVGCPINPMVQFGDFQFGANRTSFALDRALLLGWVTNNYWDTNFRARQPGPVHARYHLRLHDGFDEAAAHRLGLEAEHAQPLAQALSEPTDEDASLPTSGRFLDLPEPPVLVLQVRPEAEDAGIFHPGGSRDGDGMLVTLRNAASNPTTARIGPSLFGVRSAERLDLLGGSGSGESLAVSNGAVELELDGRETATIRLDVTS